MPDAAPNRAPIVGALVDVTLPTGRQDHDFVLPQDGAMLATVEGFKPARLDLQRPNAAALSQILLQLAPYRLPVYLACEDHGATQPWEITDVSVPSVVRVRAMYGTLSGDLVVSLAPLACPRTLTHGSPTFEASFTELSHALSEQTPVFVTSLTDDRSITHVARAPFDLDPFKTTASTLALQATEESVIACVTVVNRQRAQELFLEMHHLTCDPGCVDRQCTPFAYVRDGCTARAHQMCEQLSLRGVVAAKVWLRTSRGARPLLCPESPNIPECFADWEFHVAPVLRVDTPLGDEWRVVDPSLFDKGERVPAIEEWKARQRDPDAQYTITEAGLYYRDLFGSSPDIHDARFDLSPATLAKFRCDLIRQIERFGPPPYC